jgi:hypothetical protein
MKLPSFVAKLFKRPAQGTEPPRRDEIPAGKMADANTIQRGR